MKSVDDSESKLLLNQGPNLSEQGIYICFGPSETKQARDAQADKLSCCLTKGSPCQI